MSKKRKVAIAVILVAILIIGAISMAFVFSKKDNTTYNGASEAMLSNALSVAKNQSNKNSLPENSRITTDDFLQVGHKGTIQTLSGKIVTLQGTNLGSWLLQENLFSPITGKDKEWANMNTIKTLEVRFTQKQIATIFETYQKNWITAYDLDMIAEAGCNVVRVPFWYRNFMKDKLGEYIGGSFKASPGYKTLQWVVEEAGKRGMYVILDMHGAPGGQSLNHSTGVVGENKLYETPEYIDTMVKLWTDIAEAFAGNPVIAAYDIMNEPNNNNDFSENKPDNFYKNKERDEKAFSIYEKVIPAIRTKDSSHIIALGNCFYHKDDSRENFPKPENGMWRGIEWTNIMYEAHIYVDETNSDGEANLKDGHNAFWAQVKEFALFAQRQGAASYIGEFNNLTGITYCNMMATDNEVAQAVSWTTWTYKAGNKDYEWVKNVDFCWVYKPLDPVNPETDTYKDILHKWGEQIRTENSFEFNDSAISKIKEGTKKAS